MNPEGNPLEYQEVVVVQLMNDGAIGLNRATKKGQPQPLEVHVFDAGRGNTHFIVSPKDLRALFMLAGWNPESIVRNKILFDKSPFPEIEQLT